MEVKVINVFNNRITFENEIKKYLQKGYKVQASTIMPNTIKQEITLNIAEQKIIYYALMIKE